MRIKGARLRSPQLSINTVPGMRRITHQHIMLTQHGIELWQMALWPTSVQRVDLYERRVMILTESLFQ